jgi:class 3 adenylate cyclase
LQKGFTQFRSRVTPAELVAFLNDMYQRFDDIAAVEGIFKVEIIGDAYFGVAGCPKPCQQHAEKCALGKKF